MIIEHDALQAVVSADYKRMDQRLTILMRGMWDPEIIPILEKFRERRFNMKQLSCLQGYTEVEAALHSAAWSVCREYSGGNEYGFGNRGFYGWEGEKKPQRVEFASLQEASDTIKKAALFLGANLAGIASYDERWVYASWYDCEKKADVPARFPVRLKSVIVLAVAMDYSACLTSPSLISGAASGLGYSRMAEIGVKMATFVRRLGYTAIPCGNDTALSIPLALQAGLGEAGRSGLLVTPQYGSRVRLCTIFTDMPLQPDKPITFGVGKFCQKCRKCAQACPVGAIPLEARPTMKGPSISTCPGVLKWYIKPENCLQYWAGIGGGCINCIACCPYNKAASWHHDMVSQVAEAIGGEWLSGKLGY